MNASEEYWLPGLYKMTAVPWSKPGELRPEAVVTEALIKVGSTIIGQMVVGKYYLGKFKLTQKEPVITVKFSIAVSAFRIVDLERDDMISYRCGHSNANIIRDLYPDGHVQLRMKEVTNG